MKRPALLVALLCLPSWAAHAAGAPVGGLVYSGIVTDGAGKPPVSPVTVKVGVYAAATGDGAPALCSSKAVQAKAGTGQFVAPLDKCDDAVHAGIDLWAEVAVAGEPLPRVKLAPAAYALEAASAAAASGPLALLLAGLQTSINALTKQVGDLVAKVGDVAALKAEVDGMKDAPTASAVVLDVWFDKPQPVALPSGKALVTVTGNYDGGTSASSFPIPTVMLDGKPVGAPLPQFVANYGRALAGSVLVVATPGMHFLSLGTLNSNSGKCLTYGPGASTDPGVPGSCTAAIWMLP